MSVAPTVMTKGLLPGERMPPGPNSPSLPAAHTTVMPFLQANSTAFAIGSKSVGATGLLPMERLSTRML